MIPQGIMHDFGKERNLHDSWKFGKWVDMQAWCWGFYKLDDLHANLALCLSHLRQHGDCFLMFGFMQGAILLIWLGDLFPTAVLMHFSILVFPYPSHMIMLEIFINYIWISLHWLTFPYKHCQRIWKIWCTRGLQDPMGGRRGAVSSLDLVSFLFIKEDKN